MKRYSKACKNIKELSFYDDYVQSLNVLANNVVNSKLEDKLDNWWFVDDSFLWVDQFNKVIQTIKSKGMRLEFVGSWKAHWTAKWLSQITFGLHILALKHLSPQLQRITTKCLFNAVHVAKNLVFFFFFCNFLYAFSMLVLRMKISSELLNKLERIDSMLKLLKWAMCVAWIATSPTQVVLGNQIHLGI